MKRRKTKNDNVIEITREEELKLMQEFIEKNGVTMLPPDERLAMNTISDWNRKPSVGGTK